MTLLWLGKGAGLGFSIAAPVGPIGVLCLRTSLVEGRARGLAVGLGAATADAAYGAVAAFGLTAISSFLVRERLWLQIAGGLFLLFLGIRTWRDKPAELPAAASAGAGSPEASPPKRGQAIYAATYAAAAALTLTNPMTILSFIAVFAGFGLASAPGLAAAGFLVAGVFLGSTLWWIILTSSAGFIGRRLGSGATTLISRCSALVLLAFACAALATARRHY